jgi:hypothetical protein
MISHGSKEVIRSPSGFRRPLSGHCIEMVTASSSHLKEYFWSLPRDQDEEAIGDPFWKSSWALVRNLIPVFAILILLQTLADQYLFLGHHVEISSTVPRIFNKSCFAA